MYIFQQDNTATHRKNCTKECLDTHGVHTLLRPTKSPDLNPIESIWSIYACAVCRNQHQFTCIQDLEETILEFWYDISSYVRKRLFELLQRHCVAVIERKGSPTRY